MNRVLPLPASDGNDCATSSGIGGRCRFEHRTARTRSRTPRSNCFGNFEILHSPASIDNNPKRKVPMLIKSRFCSTYVYHRDPIESATIFW